MDGRAWKNCVKPPSTDAESEAPEEKPFMREGLEAWCVAGGGSGMTFVGGGIGARSTGFASDGFTKMRVNSPGADAGAGTGLGSNDGLGGGAVGGFDGGGAGETAAWNNRVNSPGAAFGGSKSTAVRTGVSACEEEENSGTACHAGGFVSRRTGGGGGSSSRRV